MGRPRNPERDKAKEIFIESDGTISNTDIAKEIGVPAARVRKWKSEDKWQEALQNKPRKRGGQKGNKNAAGKTPAKNGNKNAVTHGAFAQAGFEDIDPEKAQEIRTMQSTSAQARMMEELQALYLRKAYLEKLLAEYESDETGGFYTDKVVHMIVPKSAQDKQDEDDLGFEQSAEDPEGSTTEQFKTAMKSVIKSSAFERAMKVEAELNKLHGRIIKQLDSIKAYELEDRRLTLAEKQFELSKQKLLGVFDIEPEDETDIDGIVDVLDE